MTKSRLLGTVALMVGILVVPAPSPASAKIVPKKSIAGIRLRMTDDEVHATVGEPTSRFRRRFGPSDEPFPAWRYASERLLIVFVDGKALFVETRSRRERTGRGIGPGSTRTALLRGHPAANCVSTRFCELGSATGVQPKPYTGFRLRRGRVLSVELSVATP